MIRASRHGDRLSQGNGKRSTAGRAQAISQLSIVSGSPGPQAAVRLDGQCVKPTCGKVLVVRSKFDQRISSQEKSAVAQLTKLVVAGSPQSCVGVDQVEAVQARITALKGGHGRDGSRAIGFVDATQQAAAVVAPAIQVSAAVQCHAGVTAGCDLRRRGVAGIEAKNQHHAQRPQDKRRQFLTSRSFGQPQNVIKTR